MSLLNYWCNDQLFKNMQKETLEGFAVSEFLSNQYQIPKVVHFIWLGSSLPTHCSLIVEVCSRLHPDWEVRVWTDDDIAGLTNFTNKRIYDTANNYGMKSDIVRYEILYQFGGVYADVDYEFVRSLDDICSKCSFFVGMANTSAVEVNNGIIGSVPGHQILREVIDQVGVNCKHMLTPPPSSSSNINTQLLSNLMASFLSSAENESLAKATAESSFGDTIKQTGPGMLTRVIFKHLSSSSRNNSSANDDNHILDTDACVTGSRAQLVSDQVVVFHREVFSPVPNTTNTDLSDTSLASEEDRDRIRRQYVTEDTIAIHWWQKSWYKKK